MFDDILPYYNAELRFMRDMARAAADTAASLGGALERTMQALGPYLPPPADPREAFW